MDYWPADIIIIIYESIQIRLKARYCIAADQWQLDITGHQILVELNYLFYGDRVIERA